MRVAFQDLSRYAGHVLVDGAFDPLHAGHIAYLTAARVHGPLVCTVASDEQIREKGRVPLLPGDHRAEVMAGLSVVMAACLKDRPTEQIIEALRPSCYVKGPDWKGRIPEEQIDVCARYDIPISYTYTPQDSSTARLKAWALADAEQSLDRLELVMSEQRETPPERYDREYFQGQWRAEENVYTLEKRREIEGRHPQILADVFPRCSMLDVGCGPGYLVQFLRDLGVEAGGIDPSPAANELAVNRWVIQTQASFCPPRMADVVICREVLEHLTVQQVAETVSHLFRLAKKAVYITTRFSAQSVFDSETDFDTDPTHITLLSQPFVRALCVLNGGKRRSDWEQTLDHQGKGRVLCYEVVG